MSILGQMVSGRRAAVMDPHGANAWNLPMPMAGVKVDDDNALTYSPFWAAVRILTGALAGLTWHVYKRQTDGGKQRDTSDPVDPILRYRPNPEMGAFAFRETMMGWALLRGNGYAEIERNGRGVPLAVWPIAPLRVEPKRLDGGELVYEIDYGNNKPSYIRAADMFHLRGMGYDGLRGYSVLTLARECIGLGIASEKFGASFFGNGAHMGGVVTHPQKLSDKAQEHLRASLNEGHQGVSRANRILLLEEAMTWTERGVPPEDAQFLQTRLFGVQEASRWFGVPPHKLGDYSNAHFKNVEQSEIEFVTDGVIPWATRLEEEADHKLLYGGDAAAKLGEKFTKLNVKARLRGDTTAQTMHYRQMRDLGAYSVNDILELEDRNPIGPAGDIRLVPMNMQRLEDAAKEPEKPSKPIPGGPPNEAGQEQGQGNGDENGAMAYKKASARAFADAADRVLRKEAKAAKRAAGKPETFSEWSAKFYAAQGTYVREAMRTPAELLAELCAVSVGRAVSDPLLAVALVEVDLYAEMHLLRSESDLAEAHLAGNVEQICDGWLINRPGEAALYLTDHITDAVLTAVRSEHNAFAKSAT
ncbi:MAG: phage portal protein [Pseudomonadota bacterium]